MFSKKFSELNFVKQEARNIIQTEAQEVLGKKGKVKKKAKKKRDGKVSLVTIKDSGSSYQFELSQGTNNILPLLCRWYRTWFFNSRVAPRSSHPNNRKMEENFIFPR